MIEVAPRSQNQVNYDQAIILAFICNHNGKKDWRLPTEREYFYGPSSDLIELSWFQNRDSDNDWYCTLVRDIRFKYIQPPARLI